MNKHFFWLHIKKSAGLTIRSHLMPYYFKGENRVTQPKNFIQVDANEYNDVLNNFRVVLGEYQFKRCLFAKKFLYPKTWNDIYSFAFIRNPLDRCISMFFYLFWNKSGLFLSVEDYLKHSSIYINSLDLSSSFDLFLDLVEEARVSPSIYKPVDLHFTTHTASMWEDITDENSKILLNKTYRLDDLISGLNEVFEICGIEKTLRLNDIRANKNISRCDFMPSACQVKRIEAIYSSDFELYENSV